MVVESKYNLQLRFAVLISIFYFLLNTNRLLLMCLQNLQLIILVERQN